ncbi:hypothetical protein PPL_05863 [Heterostelium album PN500]|uniref:Uncharacterized protein n=1 Tax=Heterostelium pallidum (strain ATCC 26659 / Pp 5 / PN500) TaxID=670386 RepID=D3BBJ5_HETP5|nr:hypothetical protein PPL_05863 [Heterostelium album PN500]EFA81028.1 hypothetical protein PPL_05863 [Heterostelium album PN500]|eukprot:XP_020433146.1 hypothetical protein PPL_05863 [Heterostelium album PN500]
MDKILFQALFNNIVLKELIFNQVKIISKWNDLKSYKWDEVVKQPEILAYNGYFDLLKAYLNDPSTPVPPRSAQIFSMDSSVCVGAIRGGSLEMFQYLLDYYEIDRRLKVVSEQGIINDLLSCASEYDIYWTDSNRLDRDSASPMQWHPHHYPEIWSY